MGNIKISVITVCFNAELSIEKTIQSVISQSYSNIEYIIVNGASKDNTMKVVEKYKESINYIVSEPDKGIYDAMNKGLRLASGDWMIFMNAGDKFSHARSIEDSVISFNNSDICSGIATQSGQIWLPPSESELSLTFFLTKSLNHQATFIKSSLMKKYEYDSSYKSAADSLFFFRVLILKNASYQKMNVMIADCEKSGMSGNELQSYFELSNGIKNMLPSRMSYEVDFIHKYHNPAVIMIGGVLQKCTFLKKILRYYRNHKKVRK